jgi:hypothetical protein
MSEARNGLANWRSWPDVGAPPVHKALAALFPLAVFLALAGCTVGSPFRTSSSGESSVTSSNPAGATGGTTSFDTRNVAIYLETMQRLIEGEGLTQAAIFSDLEDAAEFAPTTTNRLLYALALSLPDHSGSDPEAAAARLRDLIAAGNTLTPEERMLAQIQLQSASELAILRSASADYQARLDSGLAARDQEHAQALAAAAAEIERLEAELTDVTATLDAITNIERSLSEREGNGP